MSRVCILGARGGMGSRVTRLLAEALPELRLVEAGRATGADVTEARSLAGPLAGAALCVNAAAPYDYDPGPAVRACVAAGCHYADLAEGAPFLEAAARAAREAGAAQAGVAVLPGASTAPGLVELLGLELARRAGPAAESIEAWLALGTRNPLSPGLLAGLLAPLGRPLPEEPARRAFRGGLAPRRVGGRALRFGRYPSGRPAGVAAGGRRLALAFHVGFDRPAATRALAAAAPLLARLPAAALPRLAGAALPLARSLGRRGEARGALRVEARDATGRSLEALEILAAREGLDVPALPALWIARRLLREGGLGSAGPLRLADVVPFETALAALRGHGLEVQSG